MNALTPQERERVRLDAVRREARGREALYQAGVAQLKTERTERVLALVHIDGIEAALERKAS